MISASFFSALWRFDLFPSLSHSILFPSLFIVLSVVFLFFFRSSPPPPSKNFPRVYPIFGSYFSFFVNIKRRIDWTADLVRNSPSATYVFHRPLGDRQVFTGNPANVEHILKTHFGTYEKGGIFTITLRDVLGDGIFTITLRDVLGDGIFNIDGESWKFQRQVASHEFNTRSLRKFVENVVDADLNERLVPLLASAAKSGSVIDMEDILQRFAFDNIYKIAFGFDAEYLSSSLPQPRAKFAEAFEDAVRIEETRRNSKLAFAYKCERYLSQDWASFIVHFVKASEKLSEDRKKQTKKKKKNQENSYKMIKFPRVGVILLLLVGTLVQPDEARRVLIKGKEEVWAKDKPSVIVLQTLQKGRVPPPGSHGYTPNPPGNIADNTDTRAFTDQAMAPSPEVNPVAFSSNGTIADRN